MTRIGLLLLAIPGLALAQSPGWAEDPPALSSLVDFAHKESDLRVAVVRYAEDAAAIERRYPVTYSPTRAARQSKFQQGWKKRLGELDFDSLNLEGKIDYIALRNRLDYEIEKLRLDQERSAQMAALLPFQEDIRALEEQRLDRKRIDGRIAAATLDKVARQAREATEALVDEAKKAGGVVTRKGLSRAVALRAAEQTMSLRSTLADWNTFYDGYDPTVTWWVRKPFTEAAAALQSYSDAVREHLVGIKPGGKPPLTGDPVLAGGLRADLALAMIPYTPAELVAIGEKEFKWIEDRFREVSRKMGHGDDWKAALEYTKSLAPPPGEAPWAIYEIADYSENFIAKEHSVTMAPLAREIWRLAMQSPERQLINPFFSGGEVTRLSYPTDGMSFDERLMSMRGNVPHFNFPTVQHELIPGHHLQKFMVDRFNSHRNLISDTPFWREGWALYWEFRLWDLDFPRNDADRMGMLFWRLHRAARIIFSLNYQLGNWTPQQCVDFLVDRVGFERANAEGEVRRTIRDAPLYQAAYMLGALQLRALASELVTSGRMSATDFHDAVMLGGPMPIELVRARLLGQPVPKDLKSGWRFYEVINAER
jgi:hypothetical protein